MFGMTRKVRVDPRLQAATTTHSLSCVEHKSFLLGFTIPLPTEPRDPGATVVPLGLQRICFCRNHPSFSKLFEESMRHIYMP